MKPKPLPGKAKAPLGLVILGLCLLVGCDDPPDPNPPVVPPDGAYNITQLADAISAAPAQFDTSDFIRLKGSWEDLHSRAGEVNAYEDPLGKLYAALVPLGKNSGRTIMLDFSLVSGRNIPGSTPAALNSRACKDRILALKFPADMQSIGVYAFSGCSSLKTILFSGKTAPTIEGSSFSGIPSGAEVVVPEGGEGSYAALVVPGGPLAAALLSTAAFEEVGP